MRIISKSKLLQIKSYHELNQIKEYKMINPTHIIPYTISLEKWKCIIGTTQGDWIHAAFICNDNIGLFSSTLDFNLVNHYPKSFIKTRSVYWCGYHEIPNHLINKLKSIL